MPVLSEPPSSTMFGANNNTYIFLIFAIVLTLLVTLSRKLKKEDNSPNHASPSKSRTLVAARMPSALPGKQHYLSLTLPNTTSSLKPSMQQSHQQAQLQQEHQEKQSSHSAPPPSTPTGNQTGIAKPRISRPPQQGASPPFKPLILGAMSHLHPEPPSPSLSMTLNTQFQTPQNPNQNKNQVPYHQMQFVPSPTEYASFEALYSQNPPSYHSTTAPSQSDLPSRRRSYTKSLSNGSEVSGEIVVSSSGVEGQSWRRHTRVFGGGVCKACEESERRMTA